MLRQIYCYFSANRDKKLIWVVCIFPALAIMWMHYFGGAAWWAEILADGQRVSAVVVAFGQLALLVNVAMGKILTTKGSKTIYNAIEYIESVANQTRTTKEIEGVKPPNVN